MSAKTFNISNHPKTDALFWSRVEKFGLIPDPQKYPNLVDRCWDWKGSKCNRGYGRFHDRGAVAIKAHRYSWIFHFGPLGPDDNVLHKCDNPSCLNPSHLFLGSLKDNQQDALKKGRRPIGRRVNTVKLNESQVRLIRRCAEIGIPNTFLGKLYGMPRQSIRAVVKRESWKHIP